mmetsp:Transcript_60141/g.160039  ORF Transcript_60141/g.160039 Transcript_60141/m.160039 type:complete len:122 (-) Transcript_60141:59-424(-)
MTGLIRAPVKSQAHEKGPRGHDVGVDLVSARACAGCLRCPPLGVVSNRQSVSPLPPPCLETSIGKYSCLSHLERVFASSFLCRGPPWRMLLFLIPSGIWVLTSLVKCLLVHTVKQPNPARR